jgi:hypothetical protein
MKLYLEYFLHEGKIMRVGLADNRQKSKHINSFIMVTCMLIFQQLWICIFKFHLLKFISLYKYDKLNLFLHITELPAILVVCAKLKHSTAWYKGPTSAKFQNLIFLILHPSIRGLSWSWSYGSWIYNHRLSGLSLCHSPLILLWGNLIQNLP